MESGRIPLAGTGRRIPGAARNVHPSDPSQRVSVSLYGVDQSNRSRVEAFASNHGLTVERFDANRRFMELSGTVSALERAFGVKMRSFEVGDATFRGHAEDISVPSELHGISVFGLDDLPAARPRT